MTHKGCSVIKQELKTRHDLNKFNWVIKQQTNKPAAKLEYNKDSCQFLAKDCAQYWLITLIED